MATKKVPVKFTATKTVKKPAKVSFDTKDGPVKFKAEKPVKEKEKVAFQATAKKVVKKK